MSQNAALKLLFDHTPKPQSFIDENIDDKSLRARLQFHIDCTGQSSFDVSKKIGGVVRGIEIHNFLINENVQYYDSARRAVIKYLQANEDKTFPIENPLFCETSIAQKMGAICSCCKQDSDMGIIIGASGLGKTEFLREMKRRDREMLMVTGDPTARSLGSILLLISRLLPDLYRGSRTNSAFMLNIIDALRGKGRLLVIDEAHFLSWEAFEATRKIYDATGIGLVFVGQQYLYDQMRGGSRKSLLWDQIFSRVGLRAHFKGDVPMDDVVMIANKIHPAGLDNKSMGYLHSKANGTGKLRSMVKLLQRAQRLAESENLKVNLQLLQQVNSILMT